MQKEKSKSITLFLAITDLKFASSDVTIFHHISFQLLEKSEDSVVDAEVLSFFSGFSVDFFFFFLL